MPDRHYYVSQQRGSDANDGLSPTSPWATLAKANTTVTASVDGDTYINIGPGTYRERLVLANAGIDSTHRIIWRGDPDAIRVRGDKPGRVRITGADANETPTAGHVINWNAKQFVEFWEARADGTSDLAAFYMGAAIDKTVACRQCVGAGYTAAFSGGSCYRCLGEGRTDGFRYTYAEQCVAVGSNAGCRDSTAELCWAQGYYGCSYCNSDGCIVFYANTAIYYGTGLAFAAVGCTTINLSATIAGQYAAAPTWSALDTLLARSLPPRSQLASFLRLGTVHNPNTSTAGASVALSAERFYTFTPPETGKSLGAAVFIVTKGSAAGSLVIELQKKVAGSWVTQRSATVSWASLSTGWTSAIPWSAGTGDDLLTPDADTWRFRFTSTTSDGSLDTSDNTQVACYGLFWPDSWPATDFNGLPRHQGDYWVMPGPFQPQMEELDWNIYHTYAPSLKLSRKSSSVFTLAANRDVLLTVKVWVKHVNTAGDKPAVRLRGLDITEQVAICTAPNDTWQELTLQATPTLSGVLELVFEARDPAAGAVSYFELSGVS